MYNIKTLTKFAIVVALSVIEKVPKLTYAQNKEALAIHNYFRKIHGAPDLEWSDNITRSAQDWANKCSFTHSSSIYGENLALGHPSINNAVNAWYSENRYYNYSRPGFSTTTGHFTAIIWASTRRLGCALGDCPNNKPKLWVCQYDPPGNYNSRFVTNIFPPIQHTKLPDKQNNTPSPRLVSKQPPPNTRNSTFRKSPLKPKKTKKISIKKQHQ